MAEENVVVEVEDSVDVSVDFDEIEAEYKVIVAGLDKALKGLKALAKTVKKEVGKDMVLTKGRGKGKTIGQVIEAASGPGFGAKVLNQLQE
jgi:hypothetical protein